MLHFGETSYYGNEGTVTVISEETTTKYFTTEQQKKQRQLFPRPSAMFTGFEYAEYVDVIVGDQLL
jgi:hypothetical protein